MIGVPGRRQRQGETAVAGPARGGWPLPACGKPMRIKPHLKPRVHSSQLQLFLKIKVREGFQKKKWNRQQPGGCRGTVLPL